MKYSKTLFLFSLSILTSVVVFTPAAAAERKAYTVEQKRWWSTVSNTIGLTEYCRRPNFISTGDRQKAFEWAARHRTGRGDLLDVDMREAIKGVHMLRELQMKNGAQNVVRQACRKLEGEQGKQTLREFQIDLRRLFASR